LQHHNIEQPAFIALRDGECSPADIDAAIDQLGFPIFVKPANMGSSVGVSKVARREDFMTALNLAFQYDEWAICEEFITAREIEVAVLGNMEPIASVPGEIVPAGEFYDYKDKYVNNSATLHIPALLTAEQSQEVREKALNIYKALRCDGLARGGVARGGGVHEVEEGGKVRFAAHAHASGHGLQRVAHRRGKQHGAAFAQLDRGAGEQPGRHQHAADE
jgi:D-alanine--D-alanine ligase